MKKEEIKASKHKKEVKKPTKEKIFDASVDLFSKKGFNDVTVREIAKQAGIREGSIYNHYKNKEAILDAIIDYFESEFTQSQLNEEEGLNLMDQGPEVYFEAGTRMFLDRIKSPQMEKIYRLICIETYHNEKIREFFIKQLLEEPLLGWERIFRIMIKKKLIKPVDPKTLAYEYWSFAIFLFFECYVLRYDENFNSCMNIGLEKINKHTRFLLDAIKLE
ncbi:MAG TPA: TetR/AcrR family transcriptional regulator [Methanobacterium sp.]|nr:MAG: TetR/AcrR family transcriptional regulator [Methanobacterium sp.]HOI71681.1 TetR/AcrR family transcriptional regulator [Methanobacterium sp.]